MKLLALADYWAAHPGIVAPLLAAITFGLLELAGVVDLVQERWKRGPWWATSLVTLAALTFACALHVHDRQTSTIYTAITGLAVVGVLHFGQLVVRKPTIGLIDGVALAAWVLILPGEALAPAGLLLALQLLFFGYVWQPPKGQHVPLITLMAVAGVAGLCFV